MYSSVLHVFRQCCLTILGSLFIWDKERNNALLRVTPLIIVFSMLFLNAIGFFFINAKATSKIDIPYSVEFHIFVGSACVRMLNINEKLYAYWGTSLFRNGIECNVSCPLFVESHPVQEHIYLHLCVVAQKPFYRFERINSCLIYLEIVDLEMMPNFQWSCKPLYLA